jgi:hypothetical protein
MTLLPAIKCPGGVTANCTASTTGVVEKLKHLVFISCNVLQYHVYLPSSVFLADNERPVLSATLDCLACIISAPPTLGRYQASSNTFLEQMQLIC